MCKYSDWTHSGSPTAMRNGKRLVQVDVSDIRANFARSANAHQRV